MYSTLWFRSGKKKIEKQKKIPDEFICPTSPLSISPGPYDSCSRKVLIIVSFLQKKIVDFLKITSSVDELCKVKCENLLTLMDFPENASLQHQKIDLQSSGLVKNNLTIFLVAINSFLSANRTV